jgi:hypothetical protein
MPLKKTAGSNDLTDAQGLLSQMTQLLSILCEGVFPIVTDPRNRWAFQVPAGMRPPVVRRPDKDYAEMVTRLGAAWRPFLEGLRFLADEMLLAADGGSLGFSFSMFEKVLRCLDWRFSAMGPCDDYHQLDYCLVRVTDERSVLGHTHRTTSGIIYLWRSPGKVVTINRILLHLKFHVKLLLCKVSKLSWSSNMLGGLKN